MDFSQLKVAKFGSFAFFAYLAGFALYQAHCGQYFLMEPEDFASEPEEPEDCAVPNEADKAHAEPPRVFQCSCGKTYLSYSALYSHNKQKHGGEPTNLPSGRGGRKRGRPPKNGDPARSRPKPPDPKNPPNIDQEDDTYFRNHSLMGGPVDPRLSLTPDSPLYSQVESLMQNNEGRSEDTATCNEAFAAYLIAMARRLSIEGQAQVTEFIETLRDCLNRKGVEQGEGEDCSEMSSPQSLPELSNYFVTDYFEAYPSNLERSTAIDLMLHFCRWLFVHRYSNLKLSLCDKD